MTYFQFAVQYRKTMIGPAWVLLGPTLFILTLGMLFSEVSQVSAAEFVPHLAIGFICWTLISGFVIGSTTVFQRSRAQVLQGGMSLLDIVAVDVMRTILHFLHQIVIIVVVFFLYDLKWTYYSWVCFIGLVILIINGIWLTMLFGIIGARYRDLYEIVNAVMRIAFLATPIIWLPSERAGGVMGAFLAFNPFYHFLNVIRAPLLGQPVEAVSWFVVIGFTVAGMGITTWFYHHLGRRIPLWV
jgi:ABC-2 type transport system permease protein/lipopolysaccharide transport system permease protein